MGAPDPYATARAVESAIREAARKAARGDSSLDTQKLIQLEYFNRFLSRIFSEEESEWVLKGGTGILARVPSSRSTRDIDLYRQGLPLVQALEDLRRLASVDLGDHFRFEFVSHQPSIATEAQPYTEGHRVTFQVFVGVAKRGTLQVDLAVGVGTTDEVQTSQPMTALDLPRLVSHRYRLYPVVDQIADKVCATMFDYDGRPSSREKDLVDIVVFAVTQDLNGMALARAVQTECIRRGLGPLERFVVPATWGRGYVTQSKSVPYCADYPTVEHAAALASRLIDPVLVGETDQKTWSASELRWQ